MAPVSAKTDWHLAELLAGEDDPFQGAGLVEQIGMEIDLREPTEVLNAKLHSLMLSENALDSRGVTCSMKDRDDSTCSACPISQHDNPRDPLSNLCRVGRAQEATLMEINVARLQREA